MDETLMVDETTIADDVITEITASGGEVQEEQNVEDPAVTQVKEEIAKLEQDAKNARRQLANINDEADDFSKTGYARKVAEMENMRRARSVCT
jgi:molecular chaperone GrpE (heat shock protein)